jgi:hypothetical protein
MSCRALDHGHVQYRNAALVGGDPFVGRSWERNELAAAVLVVIAAAWARSSRAPGSERHPLPRLPELGTVVLPGGFVAYDKPPAPSASRDPIHLDSAFFELDPANDIGGNHHCRAQISISALQRQIRDASCLCGPARDEALRR